MSEEFSILNLIREKRALYIYDSPDGRVLFSLLPMAEYNLIRKVGKDFPSLIPEMEEDIWERCVIEHSFGPDVFSMNAGIISTIAELIMRLSCPQDIMSVEADLAMARDDLQDITKQLMLKVAEAFPSYKPEEIEDLTWIELMERVAQAEKILGKDLEFHTHNESSLNDGSEMAPTILKDGVEVLDFEALNRELEES